MAVPDFQSMMLPVLNILGDERERSVAELYAEVAKHFQLSPEDMALLVPSGGQTLLTNRVAWVKAHFKRAGLLTNERRGFIKISDRGREVLEQNPSKIDIRFLRQFPEYEWKQTEGNDTKNLPATITPTTDTTNQTPQEMIETSIQVLRDTAAKEILERLYGCSPQFFEIIVVRLLQALGYGATGKALVTGRSGDAGIDGVIHEDKLGLDVVCVQAKRWADTVGRPVIQSFVGSMDFYRAKKGVVLTTSRFSQDAINYVEKIEGKKVVLVDGRQMAYLMYDYDVGVQVSHRYVLKEISNDFFDEEG